MNRRTNKRLGGVAASVLLGAACAAHAGPTSEWSSIGEFQSRISTQGLATERFVSAAGLGTQFDSSSWSSAAATADAQAAAASERKRALSAVVASTNTAPVVGSPAALDLTLWNFVSSIRAQQAGNPFVTLRTSAANIDYTINAVPAPVPLPASLWLFLAGLAAFVGVRRAARQPARTRHAPLAGVAVAG